MRKTILPVLVLLLTSTLLLFQNCTEGFDSVKSSASLSMGNFDLSVAHRDKEIIVRMKSADRNQDMESWATAANLTLEGGWPEKNLTYWSWTEDMDVNEVSQLMAEQDFAGEILYAEPNYILNTPPLDQEILSINSSAITSSSTQHGQTSAAIGAVEVRSILTAGKDKVVVAVIDSGVQLSHSVFVNSSGLWVNADEIAGNDIDDDSNGFVDDINGWNFVNRTNNPDDDNGHGTHCAGIVLGTGQDIFKNPLDQAKVQIMALKFLAADGSGATSNAIEAIRYAVRNGAKVLSNSWGGSTYSRALEDAIAFAYTNEVAFVAAAGNAANNNDLNPTFPATYFVPQVVSVAATDSSDLLASFSNFGPKTVVIGAPGVSILSTYLDGKFARLSGTSMATPFIAGTAALMIYERPEITSFEVKDILLQRATEVNLNDKVFQNKRLDVLQAVSAIKSAPAGNLGLLKPGFFTSLSGTSPADQGGGGGGGGCGLITTGRGKSGDGGSSSLPLLILPFALALLLRRQLVYVSK